MHTYLLCVNKWAEAAHDRCSPRWIAFLSLQEDRTHLAEGCCGGGGMYSMDLGYASPWESAGNYLLHIGSFSVASVASCASHAVLGGVGLRTRGFSGITALPTILSASQILVIPVTRGVQTRAGPTTQASSPVSGCDRTLRIQPSDETTARLTPPCRAHWPGTRGGQLSRAGVPGRRNCEAVLVLCSSLCFWRK